MAPVPQISFTRPSISQKSPHNSGIYGESMWIMKPFLLQDSYPNQDVSNGPGIPGRQASNIIQVDQKTPVISVGWNNSTYHPVKSPHVIYLFPSISRGYRCKLRIYNDFCRAEMAFQSDAISVGRFARNTRVAKTAQIFHYMDQIPAKKAPHYAYKALDYVQASPSWKFGSINGGLCFFRRMMGNKWETSAGWRVRSG